MSIEAARAHLRKWGRHEEILEFDSSSATVALAAAAAGVEPARIAKTLAFRNGDEALFEISQASGWVDVCKNWQRGFMC